MNYNKWVAMWGNAVSISENRPEAYAKNITLRYPIYCPFDGDKLKITLDNYCGTEDITISKISVMIDGKFADVTFNNNSYVTIVSKASATSDELDIDVKRGDTLYVSLYLADYTQMRSSVYIQGPLSGGKYGIGDLTHEESFDINISRKTNIYYFLSNISIRTSNENRAICCYGDSITAQDWPDYLALLLEEQGIRNVSVIRRATSGSRILREYSCITYESYGLMGKNRFEHEVPTDGCDTVIIQQGINDIIHPVGTDVNPFRPMSDMPTLDEITDGLNYYIDTAHAFGYKAILGTLLPIEGWRTYNDSKEAFKNDFNEYMRSTEKADGVIDFAKAVEDSSNPKSFDGIYDSGDHLHPSAEGYKKMAKAALSYLIDKSLL